MQEAYGIILKQLKQHFTVKLTSVNASFIKKTYPACSIPTDVCVKKTGNDTRTNRYTY